MAIRTVIGLIGTAAIAASQIDLSGTFNFTGSLQKGGVNVDPTSNLMYATVKAATIANVANLASGAPDPVDGVGLTQNDDVLVKSQTSQSANGIYNVDTVGTGANGAWTRATERDSAGEYPVGMLVYVKSGSNAGKLFKLTTFNGTLGTDSMIFDEHVEGFTVTNNGEPEAVGTGDGSTLNFDLSAANVVFLSVFVNGIMQAPSVYHLGVGAGAGGVDQLQFENGNAPASSAVIEALVFRRL